MSESSLPCRSERQSSARCLERPERNFALRGGRLPQQRDLCPRRTHAKQPPDHARQSRERTWRRRWQSSTQVADEAPLQTPAPVESGRGRSRHRERQRSAEGNRRGVRLLPSPATASLTQAAWCPTRTSQSPRRHQMHAEPTPSCSQRESSPACGETGTTTLSAAAAPPFEKESRSSVASAPFSVPVGEDGAIREGKASARAAWSAAPQQAPTLRQLPQAETFERKAAPTRAPTRRRERQRVGATSL